MSISFSDAVRRGRERAGLSQARVAQLIGKSASTVRAWEQGRTNPGDAQSVSTLAAILGLDETELLDRAGFDNPVTTSVRKSAREELSTLAAERTEMIAIKPAGITAPDLRGPRHLNDGPATKAEPFELEPTVEPVVEIIIEPTITRARKVTTMQSVPIQSTGSTAVSYLEDSEQRDFYRRRGITTALVLVFLVIVFWWALGRTGGAFVDLVESFIDGLNF